MSTFIGSPALNQSVVSSYSTQENDHDANHARLMEALSDLHDLLEDFSPAWYTENQRRKTEAALEV